MMTRPIPSGAFGNAWTPTWKMMKPPGTRLATVVVVLLALVAALWVEAQPQARVARIGVLPSGSPATSAASVDAFRERLRDLGYVEGRNIAIEVRSAGGQPERLRHVAAELVALRVDVIVASGTLATRATKEATRHERRRRRA